MCEQSDADGPQEKKNEGFQRIFREHCFLYLDSDFCSHIKALEIFAFVWCSRFGRSQVPQPGQSVTDLA